MTSSLDAYDYTITMSDIAPFILYIYIYIFGGIFIVFLLYHPVEVSGEIENA